MHQEISFPILDITEFAFEGEGAFLSQLTWEPFCTLKEEYLRRIPEWKYVDAEGKILRVEVAGKQKMRGLFSFLFQPSYHVELKLVFTGEVYELESLKNEILAKKDDMYHINKNGLMTQLDYETKLKNASSILEVIDVASFEDYKN